MPSSSQRKSAASLSSFLPSNVAFIVIGLLICIVQIINGQGGPPQTCPMAMEISPCLCQVKKNGLDILCEATDVVHITRAMTALKPKSPIIFYLKLRHNSLPKLQGFVFLALDIRHLTIHNSSLAVIEETSLSSLGMLSLFAISLPSIFSFKTHSVVFNTSIQGNQKLNSISKHN